MDIFQNEQVRVEKRIHEVVPQLEDIGHRGGIIVEQLHQLRNTLKYPQASMQKITGEDIKEEELRLKFELIKNELDAYSEYSAILIKHLTEILTEVRSKTVTLWAFGGAFSGRGLLTYLLTISAIILSSWLLSVSAVVCDNQVTNAFMTNSLVTRPLPFYCFGSVDRRLIAHSQTALVLYIARQAKIAYLAKRFTEWVITIFVVCVLYSFYRSRREGEFCKSAEGQSRIMEDAKLILFQWLVEHGHQSPSLLNSRYLEVEYLIDSIRFAGKDARTEFEYDEVSSDDGDDADDEEEEEKEESTDPEPSPEPAPVVEFSFIEV